MSFHTFAQSEFMHTWKESFQTYFQQFEKLRQLIKKRKVKELQIYAKKLFPETVSHEWRLDEAKAWDKIWSYMDSRPGVLKTCWQLKKLCPEVQGVHRIENYIFRRTEDLENVLKGNGLLLRFFPPEIQPHFLTIAIKYTAYAFNYASIDMKNDPQFIEESINMNGLVLQYVPEKTAKLQALAYNQNKASLEFCNNDFRREKQKQGIIMNRGNKITVIGDLHGDFEATIRVLKNTGVITVNRFKHNSNIDIMKNNSAVDLYLEIDYMAYNWNYSNNMLIQTGDLFDRGLNSREIIELFMHLNASSGEGQVINIAGNHEFMQYQYGMSRMARAYPVYNIPNDSMSFGNTGDWAQNRNNNLDIHKGKYGKWIRKLPIVVYEAKSKSIFSHGCVVSKWTNVEQMNNSILNIWNSNYLQHRIEQDTHDSESPINCVINGTNTNALSKEDGPVWNRYYNNAVTQQENLSEEVEKTIQAFEKHNIPVERLVCAHTPSRFPSQDSQECDFKPEKHDKVWFIDIAMTEGYGKGKRWGAIEIVTSNTTVTTAKHPEC